MLPSDFSLGTLVTLALILCVTVLTLMTYRRRRGLPPGPTCFPLLGTVGYYGALRKTGQVDDLRKKYGDVFTLMIGQTPLIVVSGSEALRELIVKHADALSDRPHGFPVQQSNKGLAGSSGELWKEQRSFALKTLRSFGFGKRSLENQIMEEVDVFLQDIAENNGKPFYIRELLALSISNIICSIVFGRRFVHTDENLNLILQLVNQNFSTPSPFRLIGDIIPWVHRLPGDITGIKKRMRNVQKILEFMRAQVHEHRKTYDEDNIKDYIDAFLYEQKKESKNPNSTFTDEQLVLSLRDLFVAGSETTATTLHWAVLFLITNPNVQKKMRQEIDNVIGQFTRPSLEHKSKLPYCEAVITEVQRLGNIAPTSLPHCAGYDVIWNGYKIPKGATVVLNLESVGLNPEIFPDPGKFDPERFLEDGKFAGQNKFIPFSLGRRVCLGESLARMEIFLFIVSLVQRFELVKENSQSKPSLEPVRGLTQSPMPFKLRALARN